MHERVIFFLSTGRTGTTSLAYRLNSDDVESHHQPKWSRLLTICSNYYLNGWLPRHYVEFLVERLREPQILASTKRIYIQVYGFDFIPASLLQEKYSNVYVVHIVRDPRTFVPSYMNWMRTRRRSFIANKLVPGWHPAGDKVGDYSREQWRRMDAFQRVCWHWSFKNRLIQELFGGDPRYYQVRFEDLFLSESPSALESLLDWCSISYTGNHEKIIERPLNVSRKKYFPSWDALSDERQRELLVICRKEMEHFGYCNHDLVRLK